MPRRTILPLVAVIACLTFVPAARANWLNGVGRHLGVGWSDGYHATNGCPQKHAASSDPNYTLESPWWSVLTPQNGQLPISASGRSHRPAGPSLFRQPGTGSSVIITDQPAGGP